MTADPKCAVPEPQDRSERPLDFAVSPGHLIRRAQQRHQTLWAERIGSELTSMQYAVLVKLDQQPGIDQRTLGRELSIDTSTLAEVCRRLDERGLIERTRHVGDSRRYRLRVTGAGREVALRTTPAVNAIAEELLEGLAACDRERFLAALRQVVGT